MEEAAVAEGDTAVAGCDAVVANGKPNGQAKAGGAADPGKIDRQQLLFCERFVEFMIDLMSQAPTRRYSHALLEDRAVLIKCRMSDLFQHEQGTPCSTCRTRSGRMFQCTVVIFSSQHRCS
jgi:hypothetical protein